MPQRGRRQVETSLEVGLSGPSRLHDLFLGIETLTPGEYRRGAQGITIRWAVADTDLQATLSHVSAGRRERAMTAALSTFPACENNASRSALVTE
jgi:AraC family transcriptional regulator of adaptative response/methylated-DNA-[protein]-cysteine methyltransferase